MKIAIDVRALLYQRTGIGYSIMQIVKCLVSNYGEHSYFPYGFRRLDKRFSLPTQMKDLEIIETMPPVPFPFRKIVRCCLEFRSNRAMQREGIELFWGPAFQGIFSRSFPTVITIHDMAHVHFPDFKDRSHNFLTSKLPEHAKRSTLILADSWATQKDISTYLNIPERKIRVVYLGVDPQFFRPIQDFDTRKNVRVRYGLDRPYFLFVGTLQPRKNIEGLIDAFHVLCERDRNVPHDLVIVGGKGWKYSEIFNRILKYRLQNRLKWIGYVDSQDLPALYSMADLFVLPSYYEGFGLPVLEAMACGTPVITSNVSSLPEVAGDAAFLIDPKSPESIAEGIDHVLRDSDLNRRLREKGIGRVKEFAWERTAAELMSAFDEVVSGKS